MTYTGSLKCIFPGARLASVLKELCFCSFWCFTDPIFFWDPGNNSIVVYIAIFESYFDYFLTPWSSRSAPDKNAFGKQKQDDGSFEYPTEYDNDDLRQTIIEHFCLIISEYWLDPVRACRPQARTTIRRPAH